MRILVIQNFYDDSPVGGAELLCRDIVTGLKDLGHEITVLSTDRGRLQSDPGLSFLEYFPVVSDLKELKTLTARLKWAAISRRNYGITSGVIQDVKPDVMYLHNLEWVTTSPLLASVESGKRMVLHAHNHQYLELWKATGSAPRHSSLRKFFKMITPDMGDARVIAISQFISNELLNAGFPKDRVKVIYNGLPKELLKRGDSALPREKKAAFVGAVSPHKGVHIAIEAIGNLKKKGLCLPLEIIGKVGTEDYLTQLRTLAKQLDVDGEVNFVGPLKREDIFKRLRTVDLFLFPSLWEEPFGLVAAEAMASGAIVIGSNRGGIPEVIGDAGFIVEPEAYKFAEAIMTVFKMSEEEKNILRLVGAGRVKDLFSFEKNVKQIEELLLGR